MDQGKGMSYWREAAGKGFSNAQFNLACALIKGKTGIAQEIFSLLASAVQFGHLEAANTLIRFATENCQAEPWITIQLYGLNKALTALEIEADSHYLLAKTYMVSGETDQYILAAIERLVVASGMGQKDAQLLLGSLHFIGKGISQNFEHAYMLFEMAASQGNTQAKLMIAAMNLEGLGIEKNPETAAKIWAELSDEGNQIARLHLAVLFEMGLGVEHDPSKSLDLLTGVTSREHKLEELVASEFDQFSTKEMVESYNTAMNAISAFKSFNEVSKAIRTLRSLAWRSYVPAIMMLGHLYQSGIGVEKSCTTALGYYSEASHLGYSPARQLVRLIVSLN
jgi:hypothetical protein